ncbi:helix-turn-helix domain-containing protein [Amycolatopsis granulosa]|uniref:helix-turn-helix domain-containing protein n=1 Tax=Amycolatopsis granulosa TaxID=185684 RepID=UPI001422F87E|nr:transcriptional regulator with XRE-family HTH domain [Amycolatopsis granulosa]
MGDEQPALFAAAVGDVLRELRTRRGWTRSDLSTRMGGAVSPSAISGYESGYRALKLELLAELCTALGVRVDTVVATADRRVRSPSPARVHVLRHRSRRHASL